MLNIVLDHDRLPARVTTYFDEKPFYICYYGIDKHGDISYYSKDRKYLISAINIHNGGKEVYYHDEHPEYFIWYMYSVLSQDL